MGTPWQFGENVSHRKGFDASVPAGQHQVVVDGAGFGSLDCIAEEPTLPADCKIRMSRSSGLLSIGILPSSVCWRAYLNRAFCKTFAVDFR